MTYIRDNAFSTAVRQKLTTRPPTDSQITKVALYARVSKDNHYQDPEVQLQPLRAMAASRGWIVEVEYIDHGVSGAKVNRPELDRLMLDVTKGRRDFGAVLVWKFDRFARSVQHLVEALEVFQENGVAFISLTEVIDTSTPWGKMVFVVLAAVAELERSLIVERTKAGLRKAVAEGKRPGRPCGAQPHRTTLWRRSKALREGN